MVEGSKEPVAPVRRHAMRAGACTGPTICGRTALTKRPAAAWEPCADLDICEKQCRRMRRGKEAQETEERGERGAAHRTSAYSMEGMSEKALA